MPAPISPKSFMDSRGTRFLVTTEYPPEKQKFLEDKLREAAKAQRLTPGGANGKEVRVFTLDEALSYFKGLKELQDIYEAAEREEKETSGPQLS
jgi:hypothetical protein